MAAFAWQIGDLDIPTATGDVVVSGLPFEPKGVFFWGTNNTADGWQDQDAVIFYGVCDAGLAQWGFTAFNKTASYDTANGLNESNAIYLLADGAGATDALGAVSAISANGFTVTFSDAAAASGIQAHYVAFGGDDFECKALLSTINVDGAHAVTGAGFTPECVLHGGMTVNGAGIEATRWHTGLGFFTGSAFRMYDCDGAGTGNDNGNIIASTVAIRHLRTTVTTAQDWQATLTSLDADGFTLNVSGGPLQGQRRGWFLMAGTDFAVGDFTSGNDVTTPGFPVGLIISIGSDRTSRDVAALRYDYSICAGDGSTRRDSIFRFGAPGSGVYRDSAFDYIRGTVASSDTFSGAGSIVPIATGFDPSDSVAGIGSICSFLAFPTVITELLGGGNRWWWWRGY